MKEIEEGVLVPETPREGIQQLIGLYRIEYRAANHSDPDPEFNIAEQIAKQFLKDDYTPPEKPLAVMSRAAPAPLTKAQSALQKIIDARIEDFPENAGPIDVPHSEKILYAHIGKLDAIAREGLES